MRRSGLLPYYLLALGIASTVVLLGVVLPTGDVLAGLYRYLVEHRFYANIISIGRFAAQVNPWAFLIFVYAAAPSLAALIVSAARGEVSGLLGRLRPYLPPVSAPSAVRIYGFVFLAHLIISAIYLVIAKTQGTPAEWERIAGAIGETPLLAIWSAVRGGFIDEGGSLEELGWRGYALPRLLDRYGDPLKASLVLGALWWAWHLPREVPGLLAQGVSLSFLSGQLSFLALCVGLSVVITAFWLRTGGSVWPGILVHGMTNYWSKAVAGTVNRLAGTDARTVAVMVGAVVVVALLGRRLGGRAEPAPMTG